MQPQYSIHDLHEGKVTRSQFFNGQIKCLTYVRFVSDWSQIMTTYLQEFFLFLTDIAKESRSSQIKNAVNNYFAQREFLQNWERLSPFAKQQMTIYVEAVHSGAMLYPKFLRDRLEKENEGNLREPFCEVEIQAKSKGNTPYKCLIDVINQTTVFVGHLPLQGDNVQKTVKSFMIKALDELWYFALHDFIDHNTETKYFLSIGLSIKDQQIVFTDARDAGVLAPMYGIFSPTLLRMEIDAMMNSIENIYEDHIGTGKCPLTLDWQKTFKGYVREGLIYVCADAYCTDRICSKLLVQRSASFMAKFAFTLEERDSSIFLSYLGNMREPQENELSHYLIIRYFVSRGIYSPQCVEILLAMKKHNVRDNSSFFTEKDICSIKFKNSMTVIVGKYYQCMNENDLVFAGPILKYNIIEHSRVMCLKAEREKHAALKCVDEYFAKYIKSAEGDRIKRPWFPDLTPEQRNIIFSYLASYFFINTLHASRDEDAKIILDTRKMTDQFFNDEETLYKQLKTQCDGTFLATLCIVLCHVNFTDAYFYHENMPKYVHENLDPNSLRNLIACYETYKIVSTKKFTIDVDHEDIHNSVHAQMSCHDVSVGSTDIQVSYYSMIQDSKIYHAGVDQKGLLRHCIQKSIDLFMKKPYVKRDEDGRIYFDCGEQSHSKLKDDERNAISNEQIGDAINFASLFLLIISSGEAVDFPIKEELLREFCDESTKVSSISSQMVLPTSYKECLIKTIALFKENKINRQEYEENIQMIQREHHKKYFQQSANFLIVVKKTIKRELLSGVHRLYFQKLCSLFYREFNMSSQSVSDVIQLAGKDEAVTEAKADATIKVLKQIVKNMEEDQIKKFVILAQGKLKNVKSIRVIIKNLKMLPTWSSCSSRMEIGIDFCEERLIYAMENVDGFHLV